MVNPQPVTFWGHEKIGSFETPEAGVGRIHYSPANPQDERRVAWSVRVQGALHGVLARVREKVKFAQGQTASSWPLIPQKETVYVNTVGPRFETRAEIRSYRGCAVLCCWYKVKGLGFRAALPAPSQTSSSLILWYAMYVCM
ncbi:GIP [Symbiodinium microadriaticum]|nr:GIP [Symbiodinium microadriaticum]